MGRQLLAAGLLNRKIGGEEVVSALPRLGFAHPWSVLQCAWLPGDFGSGQRKGAWMVVIKPGFVNGIDPLVKGACGYDEGAFYGAAVSSQRAGLGMAQGEVAVVGEVVDKREIFYGGQRKDLPLLRGPLLSLPFHRGQQWPQARAVPKAIELRGVPARAAGGDAVSVDGERVTINQTRLNEAAEAAAKPQRMAYTLDVMAAVARVTITEDVGVRSDLGSVSGRIVDYSVRYDDLVIRTQGQRPFLYAVGSAEDAMKVPEISLEERFFGKRQADDGLDKVHILRAWAISPQFSGGDAPETVGADWDVVFEYKQFWNLAYKTRIPRLVQPPPPISYHSNLAWGLGDAIINANLGLQDEILQRILLAGANLAPKGKFWNAG